MSDCTTQVNMNADEMAKQREYAQLVAMIISSRIGDNPLAFVHTYGCQGNVADGERIKGMLGEMGFGFTDDITQADLVLYNTCAIREHAEDRIFGNVGALKKIKNERRHMKIVLCGCMMQQSSVALRIEKSYPFVDLVFGTHVLHRLPELLYRLYCTGKSIYELPDSDGVIAEGIPVRRDSSYRAFIPIMYGCNNFCSYCIVPYVRGRERSRTPQAVIDEARDAVGKGYREIMLLGQNVNSYDSGGEMSFARLLHEINDIPGEFIIRFMTSHPKDCTRELLDTMASCEKVAEHLHLPVQSGSDRILTAMNRRYTREKYLDLISYARKVMPDISITSDIIVGFPGETDEEFEQTLSLVREVKYSSLFMFIYSPRPGTAAARMDDPVTREEKVRRFQSLEQLQAQCSRDIAQTMNGKTFRVLCEGTDENGMLTGKTRGGMSVTFTGNSSDNDNKKGSFCDVCITQTPSWNLIGKEL